MKWKYFISRVKRLKIINPAGRQKMPPWRISDKSVPNDKIVFFLKKYGKPPLNVSIFSYLNKKTIKTFFSSSRVKIHSINYRIIQDWRNMNVLIIKFFLLRCCFVDVFPAAKWWSSNLCVFGEQPSWRTKLSSHPWH